MEPSSEVESSTQNGFQFRHVIPTKKFTFVIARDRLVAVKLLSDREIRS